MGQGMKLFLLWDRIAEHCCSLAVIQQNFPARSTASVVQGNASCDSEVNKPRTAVQQQMREESQHPVLLSLLRPLAAFISAFLTLACKSVFSGTYQVQGDMS